LLRLGRLPLPPPLLLLLLLLLLQLLGRWQLRLGLGVRQALLLVL